MLFGYIEDEHYVDLVDENKKLFKRFRDDFECETWITLYSDYPDSLRGLTKRETVVKWYESNKQLAKLAFPLVFVLFSLFWF